MKLALSNWPVAGIVDRVFHQRLADALHRAAMHLARKQQRIKRGAEVIDNDVTHDVRRAGVRIDFDFGDVRAIRKRRRLDAELLRRAQFVGRRVRMRGEIGKRDHAVGAGNADSSIRDFQIARCRFQSVGGNLLDLLGELLGRTVNGNAADRNRTRPAGAGAALDPIGIALHHAHTLRRQVETLGNKLRVGRGVALAGRLRADQQGDAAVAIERKRRSLRAVVAAGLDIGGDADAAQPARRVWIAPRAC